MTVRKRIEIFLMALLMVGVFSPFLRGQKAYAATAPKLTYQTHIQGIGWTGAKNNEQQSGTTGQAKRLEAIKINLAGNSYAGSLSYNVHVQNIGWQGWKTSGQQAGTTGEAKRLEAIQIKLNGAIANYYDIYYRVHVQNIGTTAWVKNGQTAGTTGKGYRLEAIWIQLVPKTSYQSHVQNIGWQNWKTGGQLSGTTGQSKRIEAFKVSLAAPSLYAGSVSYKAHVQNIGWQAEKSQSAVAGTTGQSKRVEAVQIKLNGEMANHYDIYYQTHVQSYGTLGWAKNGEIAGTTNCAYRLEAIWIQLVPKGAAAPGSTVGAYKQSPKHKSLVSANDKGVDVSEWQGYISQANWQKAKNSGIQYAMLRIAWGHKGNGAADKQFNNNYQNARANNIPIGAYVYSYADDEKEARQEADYAVSLLAGRKLQLPVCIDVEDERIGYLSKTQQAKNIVAFCEQVKAKGYTPMVYANQNWLNNKIEYSRIKNYRIWYAQYPYHWSESSKPSYGNHIDIWQYSSSGKVSGLSGNIDMNKAYAAF